MLTPDVTAVGAEQQLIFSELWFSPTINNEASLCFGEALLPRSAAGISTDHRMSCELGSTTHSGTNIARGSETAPELE